jgi:hypothetical protein
MTEFTPLELSVLDAICIAYGGAHPGIAERVGTAVFLSRENTGHGFYTEFNSTAGVPEPSWPAPIDGPHARMIGMGEDALMGFIMWVNMDGANTLEGFQIGVAAGGETDLRALNLSELRFSGLVWPNKA